MEKREKRENVKKSRKRNKKKKLREKVKGFAKEKNIQRGKRKGQAA